MRQFFRGILIGALFLGSALSCFAATSHSTLDAGFGLSADQEKVFSKFFRAENAKKKKEIGTGLGLATSKNLIEKHGGKIWFSSTENEGSTFYFSLPIQGNPDSISTI